MGKIGALLICIIFLTGCECAEALGKRRSKGSDAHKNFTYFKRSSIRGIYKFEDKNIICYIDTGAELTACHWKIPHILKKEKHAPVPFKDEKKEKGWQDY